MNAGIFTTDHVVVDTVPCGRSGDSGLLRRDTPTAGPFRVASTFRDWFENRLYHLILLFITLSMVLQSHRIIIKQCLRYIVDEIDDYSRGQKSNVGTFESAKIARRLNG